MTGKKYKVRRTRDGILLLDKSEFAHFKDGDEALVKITRVRPMGCISLKEVSGRLSVSYGVLRTGIYTGRYKLPKKQERLGRCDFYNEEKIKKWVENVRKN
jgi:hypothetical protein